MNCLGKGDLTELKALMSPPKLVGMSCDALLVCLGVQDPDWKKAKAMMADPEKMLSMLKGYDLDKISPKILKKLD